MDPRRIDDFIGQFLAPLVTGGQVQVGRPLGGPELDVLVGEAASAAAGSEMRAVEWACRLRAAELWADPCACDLDRDALRLAVGAHNLLFLAHPDYEHGAARRSSKRRLHLFIEECFAGGAPETVDQLVFRHVLLGNLLRLSRRDVEVTFWAGRRRFVGQTPPDRLLWWPDLRRVHISRQTNMWVHDLPEDLLGLVTRYLRCTPLTDLLLPARPGPAFDWLEVAPALSHRGVCRLACYRYLERGLSEVQVPLSDAFWALANADTPSDHQRHALGLAARLVIHLFALQDMGQGRSDAAVAARPLRSDTGGDPLEIVLWAADQCGLLPPDEVWADPQVAERLQQRVERAGAAVGEIDEIHAARLDDVLAGRAGPPRLVSGRMVSGTLTVPEEDDINEQL